METSSEFCWRVLPAVSRSFAMVIRQLPPALAEAVMVSYLLCRIADSVEDSLIPLPQKRARLTQLPTAMDGSSTSFVMKGAHEPYRELMAKPEQVFACYRGLPSEARDAIRACVAEMAEGMADWSSRTIGSWADQDRYCYYVAGVVGKLLTELFRIYRLVSNTTATELQKRAVDFGLALQKINILRDVREDMKEGRCYWPEDVLRAHGLSRETLLETTNLAHGVRVLNELVRNVVPYVTSAVRYIELLPAGQSRLRSFCAVPLFMATATARVCQGNPEVLQADSPVKIPRHEARMIVLRARLFGWSNAYLRGWHRRDIARLGEEQPAARRQPAELARARE